MLTFEKVLAIFDDYLQQDPLYEVVFTITSEKQSRKKMQKVVK